MKNISHHIARLCALLSLFPLTACSQTTSIAITPDDVMQSIFLGQVYPSGRLYLKGFVEREPQLAKWPKAVNAIPLAKPTAETGSTISANIMKMLKDKTVDHTLHVRYIPGFEGMDPSHDNCGIPAKEAANPKYKYLSADFYSAIMDHCESNNGIVIYQSPANNMYSYAVIAAAKPIELIEQKIMNTDSRRPLTKTEAKEVKALKRRTKAEQADYECTTEPAYLDDAKQLFTAKIKGSGLHIRLSFYETPGCAGHLSSIYILDVLQEGKIVGTFELNQYQGAI